MFDARKCVFRNQNGFIAVDCRNNWGSTPPCCLIFEIALFSLPNPGQLVRIGGRAAGRSGRGFAVSRYRRIPTGLTPSPDIFAGSIYFPSPGEFTTWEAAWKVLDHDQYIAPSITLGETMRDWIKQSWDEFIMGLSPIIVYVIFGILIGAGLTAVYGGMIQWWLR